MSHDPNLPSDEMLPLEWPQTPEDAAEMIVIYQGILARVAESNGLTQTVEMLMHSADMARDEVASMRGSEIARKRVTN